MVVSSSLCFRKWGNLCRYGAVDVDTGVVQTLAGNGTRGGADGAVGGGVQVERSCHTHSLRKRLLVSFHSTLTRDEKVMKAPGFKPLLFHTGQLVALRRGDERRDVRRARRGGGGGG